MNDTLAQVRQIKSYVLRAGRMTGAQKRAYELLSPKYLIPFGTGLNSLEPFFANNRPLTLEIGFGMGAATAIIAENNPEKNYIGVEVHPPGIGRLLWEIEKRGLNNIRIIEYDAAGVFEKMIPPSCLEALHIFFPDPWPKKRHHKRRLIRRPFTCLLARSLAPGGYLYMVTDWENYGDEALDELRATPGLKNPYADFAPPRLWRPRTRFEQKGLNKNHHVRELFFLRDDSEITEAVQ
jgi:tRNA (guanine-N7-)-methyltransferase